MFVFFGLPKMDANVEQADKLQFIEAIESGNTTQLANLIVKNWHLIKCKISAKDDPPLLYVCRKAKPNKQIVSTLLEVGADPEETNKAGNFALLACKDVEIAALLISKGANPRRVREKSGFNIFTKAMNKANIPIVFYLLAKKIFSPNELVKQRSFLSIATELGNIEIVKLLVKYGAQIDLRFGDMGITAIHVAVSQNNIPLIKYFVEECKCDVNLASRDNSTPITRAAIQGFLEGTKYLAEHGALLNNELVQQLLLSCMAMNQMEVVYFLFNFYKPTFNKDETVTTMIMCEAVKKGATLDFIKNLVTRGASVHGTNEYTGNTIVDEALFAGNLQIIQFLLLLNATPREAINEKNLPKLSQQVQDFLMRVTRVEVLLQPSNTCFPITCWNYDMFLQLMKSRVKSKENIECEYLDAETQDFKPLGISVLRAFNNNTITLRVKQMK